MRTLLIKIGASGDVLRTTSLLPGLAEKYPKTTIDWLTESANYDILSGNPRLENIFSIDNLPKTFRTRRYDLVINLDEDPDVCYLATQLKPKKIIGTYLKNRKVIYTLDASPRFDMSRISRLGMEEADKLKKQNTKTYQEMCYEMLGLHPRLDRPFLHIPPSDHAFAKKFALSHGINKNDQVIGISSSAGHKWPNKRLSIEETAELIALLHKRRPKAKIILLGGPNEAVRNSEIHSNTPKVINPGCHHPMKRFAALLNLCQTLITSDSFPLHIGTALDKHVVAFFGPTSPHEIELYGKGSKILPKTGCVACFKPHCTVPLKYDIDAIVRAV